MQPPPWTRLCSAPYTHTTHTTHTHTHTLVSFFFVLFYLRGKTNSPPSLLSFCVFPPLDVRSIQHQKRNLVYRQKRPSVEAKETKAPRTGDVLTWMPSRRKGDTLTLRSCRLRSTVCRTSAKPPAVSLPPHPHAKHIHHKQEQNSE